MRSHNRKDEKVKAGINPRNNKPWPTEKEHVSRQEDTIQANEEELPEPESLLQSVTEAPKTKALPNVRTPHVDA